MESNPGTLRGLNLLALDGGGITGLSSLYILREIMDRLQARGALPIRPEPWECFDLIAGTGTGAVSAIMLGRLRLGIDDTIRLYHQLMSDVFSARRRAGLGPRPRETTLEEGLKKIISDVTGDAEETLLGKHPQNTRCKVVTYAMSAHNLTASLPCAFRTYRATLNVLSDCSIWKALRASMANPELFKSFTIEEHGLKREFIGGGLGCNNPTAELLKEASALFPARFVSCVVSVGTGHAQTIQLPEPIASTCGLLPPLGQSLPLRLLRATRGLAEDSEKVAEDMAARFSRTSDLYFRLNVNQGMQSIRSSDWEQQDAVAGHARAYLRLTEVGVHLERLVEAIQERRTMFMTTQIDGRLDTPSPRISTLPNIVENRNIPNFESDGRSPASPGSVSAKFEYCPRSTFMFKGRKLQIQKASKYFGNEDEPQHVFVLHGLGGAGKTQTALKCAEFMAERFEGVLFVDGSSRSSIEISLSQFAVAKRFGREYADTLRWFKHRRGRWMMLFDNVDDLDVRVQDYFPQADRYDILITTRHTVVAYQARGQDSECKIDEMDPDEALELLLEAARLQINSLETEEIEVATRLLQELGFLALAIVQCGAFIYRTHCTITRYYEMYLRERRQTLEGDGMVAFRLDDYEHSVFTTWALNRPLADTPTERLWKLFVYMHRNCISEAIFRRAFENFAQYTPEIPPTEPEISIRREVLEVLSLFADADGTWNSRKFISAIEGLVGQSMINHDEINDIYHLHPLVQQWARVTIDESSVPKNTSLLLALSINAQRSTNDHAYRRAILPHVSEILKLCPEPNPNDAWQFVAVYSTMGNSAAAEALEKLVVQSRTHALGSEHPSTIESISYAAVTQRELGRSKKAQEMHSQVLDFRKRVLGLDHPDTLLSMGHLAVTYRDQGRLMDAESLQVESLAAHKRVVGANHPNTLSSMANLAATYYRQGRMKDAESLGVEVLAARKRVLGGDHPNTLQSMAHLALTYSKQGRLAHAEGLGIEVLAASRRILGDDHPNTLISKANLAAGYFKQGRLSGAQTLEIEVLAARKRVLGEDHPDTLTSMANLALTYSKLEQLSEAEELEVAVLSGCKRVLGEDHPDTLQCMADLASIYCEQGRLKEAESLEAELLATRKEVLGKDHPNTLQSMTNLAVTYYKQGRMAEAESLEVEALGARIRVLGKDHPDTLSSMANLAETYDSLGRFVEVESLESKLVAARKRVLGKDHPETLSSMANLAATYHRLGRMEEAKKLEVQALAMRKGVLGENHPDTMLSMTNLAIIYYQQGRMVDAERLQNELLSVQKRTLGDDHPDTLLTMANLVRTYYKQGQMADAESLGIEVLAARERVLGKDHPDTRRSALHLSMVKRNRTHVTISRLRWPKLLPWKSGNTGH